MIEVFGLAWSGYLKSKQDSLSRNDREIREEHGMMQFLDEKSYRPGLGPFRKVEED